MMRLAHFIATLIIGTALHAGSISAQYDVSFSVFGKIGEARLLYETYDQFYHIQIDAKLTGAAASMGNNRREIYESFGVAKAGVLHPELYIKKRLTDSRTAISYYIFNTSDKSVQRYYFNEKRIHKSHFDFLKMKNIETITVEKNHSVETLPFKTQDDLLSLFFNVRTLLSDIPEGSYLARTAAGAKGENGEVLITNPAGKKRQELADLMPKNHNLLLTVIINQDIFKSDKGELYISLDTDYLAEEAMLKDVLLFGDIRGKRVWQKGSLE